MPLTESHDLRSGATPWDDSWTPPSPDPLPDRPVDVAIVGAGVMGAMLAEQLSAAGKSVALIDRRPPASGSTAASTALVLWEADVPLSHLAARIGAQAAVARWRRVAAAVARLADRIDAERLCDGDRIDRASLYLDGDLLDEPGLRNEADLRRGHGLPSEFLPAAAVAERFGIAARPALVSGDSFEVDPVGLTLDLLARARANGATVAFPCDVRALTHDGAVVVMTDQGDLCARDVILAGGYERAPLFLPPAFSLHTSFAIATAPGVAPLWRENAMIWEASERYLYARADADGRIIAGGGDEDYADPAARDRAIPAKAAAIAGDLSRLTGHEIEPRERWAALFGASPDGLPAIGRARPGEHVWLASGFGGNGVTFAALAAELLTAELAGTPDPDLALFDPYRFG